MHANKETIFCAWGSTAKSSTFKSLVMDGEREVPLVVDGVREELALVRFNFVPEGMTRCGAQLNLDDKTRQASFESVHSEKVRLAFHFFLWPTLIYSSKLSLCVSE